MQWFLVRWMDRPDPDTTWITQTMLQQIDPALFEHYRCEQD